MAASSERKEKNQEQVAKLFGEPRAKQQKLGFLKIDEETQAMKQQVEVGKFNVLGKRIIKAYFDPVNVCLNVDNLEHYLSMNDKIEHEPKASA